MLIFAPLGEVRGFQALTLFQMKTLTRMRIKFETLLAGPERSKARFRWFNGRSFLALLAAGLLAGGFAPRALGQNQPAAAVNPAPAPLSENRFLIVLDTSAGMKRQGDKTRAVVESMLRSGFNGQLHAGDTIGVWTFNEDVYTGRMGLQRWTPGDSEEIVSRTLEFLRRQPFEKKSRFDMAMSAVSKVVKLSDVITVVIVTDGKNPIEGTPVDGAINSQYLQSLKDNKKNPPPIVTVLQGRGGQFTRQYSVSALPWPVVIPELPISLKLAKAAEPAPAPKAPAHVAPPGPTMILVGPQPPDFPLPAQTAAAVAAPKPAPAPAPAAPTPQPVASTSQPPEVSPASPGPAPAAAPQVAPVTPSGSTVSAFRPPIAATPAESTPAASAPAAFQNPIFMPPPRAASQPPITPPPAEPVPAVTVPVVAQNPAPTPVPTTPAAVAESSAKSAAPVAVASAPADASLKHPTPATPAPSRPAVASPSGWLTRSFTGLPRTTWVVGGVCLLVVGLTLTALFSRHPRGSGRVSLISQTMNK
jgi:hypothetical protein